MAEILRAPIEAPSAWLSDELARNDDWIVRLDDGEVGELERALAAAKRQKRPLADMTREDFPLPRLGEKLATLADDLEGGRGYALLRGIPVERHSDEDCALMLWGIGTHLGVAEPQDRAGSLLHHVRDTGQSTASSDSVRSYQTSEEIVFHNDGADVFALLCVRAARSGGLSRIVSAVAVFNELLRRRPDLAEVAQRPFHFDVRAQRPDDAKTQAVPIYNFHAGRLNVLAKRHYIDFAQRFAEVPPLTPEQRVTLDLIDEIAGDPRFCFSFAMQPGDIQLGNNYVVMHSRTSYVDHDEPARKRHMLRLWLTLYRARPLPPIFAHTREFGPTYARRRSDTRVTELAGS